MSYKKYRHELNGKIMILETTLELLESNDLSIDEYRRLLECFKKAIVDLKALSQAINSLQVEATQIEINSPCKYIILSLIDLN